MEYSLLRSQTWWGNHRCYPVQQCMLWCFVMWISFNVTGALCKEIQWLHQMQCGEFLTFEMKGYVPCTQNWLLAYIAVHASQMYDNIIIIFWTVYVCRWIVTMSLVYVCLIMSLCVCVYMHCASMCISPRSPQGNYTYIKGLGTSAPTLRGPFTTAWWF